jgi:hypothetical protein
LINKNLKGENVKDKKECNGLITVIDIIFLSNIAVFMVSLNSFALLL